MTAKRKKRTVAAIRPGAAPERLLAGFGGNPDWSRRARQLARRYNLTPLVDETVEEAEERLDSFEQEGGE